MSGVLCEVLSVLFKVSHVRCDMSGVTYQVSCVTGYMSEMVKAMSPSQMPSVSYFTLGVP